MIDLFVGNGLLAFLQVCNFLRDHLLHGIEDGETSVLFGGALCEGGDLLVLGGDALIKIVDARIKLGDALIKLFKPGVPGGGALCGCGRVFVGGGESGHFGCLVARHAGFEVPVLSLGRL